MSNQSLKLQVTNALNLFSEKFTIHQALNMMASGTDLMDTIKMMDLSEEVAERLHLKIRNIVAMNFI